MEVTCPNAACAAVYTVGPQHLGKSFPCRACATTVSVNIPVGGPTGPTPAAGSAAVPVNAPSVSADLTKDSAATTTVGRSIATRLSRVRAPADLASWTLGLGLFLVLLFMFFPVLDAANATRIRAKIEAGDTYQRRSDRDLNDRPNQGGTAPTAEEQNARKKAKEDWQKAKIGLDDEAQDAAHAASTNRYWHTWGVLIGSLLIAGSSMNYLATSQTRTRRVVGGVLVCFVAILVLTTFNILSIAAMFDLRK